MLVGTIQTPGTHTHLLTQPVWQTIFTWIREHAQDPDGEYEIDGRNIYASVQTIQTIPRNEGVFEAHFEYIDLHYCLEGSEIVEWAPVDVLGEPTKKDAEHDYALFTPPQEATSIRMTPGAFAIFFPEDAHMPKIRSGDDAHTRKIVVKINRASL